MFVFAKPRGTAHLHMASAASFLGFLALLLLPAALREYLPAASNRRPPNDSVGDADELHPIVLIPGGSCSELEARLTDAYRPSVARCGAMKGKGWFGLWQNASDLVENGYVPCFMEQMSLVYDPAANDYRNIAGVETRVLNFGTTTGFYSNPAHLNWCLETLRHTLERIGYRDSETLFGAAYDFRRVPPFPGLPSQFYSGYFRQLMALVENAAGRNKKKVILFGHSYGGTVALEFVRSVPMAWRDRYIKHLFLVSPVPDGGVALAVQYFLSGLSMLNVPTVTALSLRPMWRTFEAALVSFPAPSVFGDDTPVVTTGRRNYTARDMADLFADAGAADVLEPFRRRMLPRLSSRNSEPPMVPVTCVNGVGVDTPERLVYPDGNFDVEPEIVYGDGDNSINLASMLAFDDEMRRWPGQRDMFKTIKIHGGSHGSVLTADWSLKRVMQEIAEVNRNN